MRIAIAFLLAASALLAGCDGRLKFQGQVLGPDGRPAGPVPVQLFLEGKADQSDPVLWTDTDGRFSLSRTDCPCDFDIELVATHPALGQARVATTHRALEKNPLVVMTLVQPTPDPALRAARDAADPPEEATRP